MCAMLLCDFVIMSDYGFAKCFLLPYFRPISIATMHGLVADTTEYDQTFT